MILGNPLKYSFAIKKLKKSSVFTHVKPRYSLTDAALLLSIDQSELLEEINTGKLKTYTHKSTQYIDTLSIDEYVETCRIESPEYEQFLNMSIDVLELPTRAHNTLIQENIETLKDISKCSKLDLMKMPGIGKTTFREIIDVMEVLEINLDIF